jgi:hypothetical protein
MPSLEFPNGLTFAVHIKTKDVQLVKDHVAYPDGKPFDMFEEAETGHFIEFSGDIRNFEMLADTMFFLCLDQVLQNFDADKFDKDHEKIYAAVPERRDEPVMIKASRWFGELFEGSGSLYAELPDIFREAVLDFIPNRSKKAALASVLEKQKRLDEAECRFRLKSMENYYKTAEQTVAKEWTEKSQAMQKSLAGPSGLSTNTPESSE